MPLNTSSLIRAAEIVARNNDLKVTLTNSFQGALMTGASTLIGGLVGGSKGLMLGGIVGGACAMMASDGKFKSVVSIISEMDPKERESLAKYIREALIDIGVTEVAGIATQSAVSHSITRALQCYFRNEKNLNLLQ